MNDTKEHILHTSLALFMKKSFKEVTMKELVEKTGMSKGAFYHYFESKEQLFKEIVMEVFSKANIAYANICKESLYQFYHDYIDNLKRIELEYLNLISGDESFNFISFVFEALKLFPEFKGAFYESQQSELNEWVNVISTARKSGEIKSKMTDEQIAKIFIYTNDGISLRELINGSSHSFTNGIVDFWDSIYELIKA